MNVYTLDAFETMIMGLLGALLYDVSPVAVLPLVVLHPTFSMRHPHLL